MHKQASDYTGRFRFTLVGAVQIEQAGRIVVEGQESAGTGCHDSPSLSHPTGVEGVGCRVLGLADQRLIVEYDHAAESKIIKYIQIYHSLNIILKAINLSL